MQNYKLCFSGWLLPLGQSPTNPMGALWATAACPANRQPGTTYKFKTVNFVVPEALPLMKTLEFTRIKSEPTRRGLLIDAPGALAIAV